MSSGCDRRMSAQVWPSTIRVTTCATVIQVPRTTGDSFETLKSKTSRSCQRGRGASSSSSTGRTGHSFDAVGGRPSGRQVEHDARPGVPLGPNAISSARRRSIQRVEHAAERTLGAVGLTAEEPIRTSRRRGSPVAFGVDRLAKPPGRDNRPLDVDRLDRPDRGQFFAGSRPTSPRTRRGPRRT